MGQVGLEPRSPDHQCEISELHFGERRPCEEFGSSLQRQILHVDMQHGKEFGPTLQKEILSLCMQHDPKRLQDVCKTHYDRTKLAFGVTDQKAVAATNLFFFKVLGTNEVTQGAIIETSRIYRCEIDHF